MSSSLSNTLKRGRGGPTTERTHDRPHRVPLSEQRARLKAKYREPGFQYRFVNDTEDRIERFQVAGYEVVNHKTETRDPGAGADTVVGSPVAVSVGGGTKAVLMRIPQDWYDEDQKKKQEKIKAQEATMRRDIPKAGDADGNYGSVKIDNQRA
jgi:hypothetical protein